MKVLQVNVVFDLLLLVGSAFIFYTTFHADTKMLALNKL